MTLSLDILERNLSALEVRQPAIARLIRDCEFPEGLVPAIGRDGTPTWQLPGEGGFVWLGGSSMPRASAEEMFGNVDPRGGSVTLPAMLTGMEAQVLAERLAPRFAVFVVDEPQAFRMALTLRDYQSQFCTGRIVLLLSDDIPARARAFFGGHPGFVFPAHMFKVPQVPAGKSANLARTLEDAGAAAMGFQNEFISARVSRMRAVEMHDVSETPRIILLAADDSTTTIELARRLERACGSVARTWESCLPIRPEQCHAAARIAAVERSGAELILYLNGAPRDERSFHSLQIPIVDWLPHGAALPDRRRSDSYEIVVAESWSETLRLLAAGWPAEKVVLMEPAVDIVPGEDGEERVDLNGQTTVAVMMDLPDDRPEAVGVTLPSHMALWQSLQQEVLRRSDRYAAVDAGEVLRAAQQSSGTVLTDASLNSSFESWLQTRIAPATVARSHALTLVKNGFRPAIWGRNWPVLGRGQDLCRGAFPADPHRLFERPAWVVIPWFSHAGVQLAVDAMSRGSVVIMHGTRDSFAAEYPGLGDLTDSIHWFRTAGQLLAALRRLIDRHENAGETAQTVVQRIHNEHTVAHRLRKVIEIVRAAQLRNIVGRSA